jgi:hypothetical protein
VLGIIGFLLLAGVAAWEWTQIDDVRGQVAAQGAGGAEQAQLRTLQDQLRTTKEDLQTLASKPPPAPPPAPAVDLGPIEARLTALEKRPEPKPVDLGPLEARVAALERRPTPPPYNDSALKAGLVALARDAAATKSALAALTADLARAVAAAKDEQAALTSNATATRDQLATLARDETSAKDELRQQIAATTARLDTLEQQIAATRTASAKSDQAATEAADRAARLDAATLALDAGKPLGPLPDAPPILQRFATQPPPTEASLRLSFESAAKAAQAASDAAAGSTDLAQRMWDRVQTLVTVRRGDKVLVGNPASVVLADARRYLVAGDLADAVRALDRLDPKAAAAMAPWRAQAEDLLKARAAMASLGAATQPATP